MRKPLLLLLLLILLVAGLGYFLVGSWRGDGSVESAGASGAASAAEQAQRSPAELRLGADASGAAAGGAGGLAGVDPGSVAGKRRLGSGLLELRGRVVLPESLPRDELARVDVFLPAAEDDDQRRADEPFESTELAPDGRFALELATNAETVWLMAAGRYLHSPRPTRVDLPRTEQDELLVPASLGAWVTGSVALPAGADQASLGESGRELTLEPDAFSQVGMAGLLAAGQGRELAAELDDALRFEFTGVPGGRSWQLEFVPEQLAVPPTSFEAQPGAHVELELALRSGSPVSGIVVDPTGAPVAGAEIEVRRDAIMFGQGGRRVRKGETDAQGRFELPAVLPGELQISAEADGYIAANRGIEVLEGQAVTGVQLELDRGNRVAGRLSWPDGSAAGQVDVRLTFDPSFLGGMEAFGAMRGAEGRATTDAEGAFEIFGLGPGPFLVTASATPADAGESATAWRARADAIRPGEGHQLVLQPPLGIGGRVVDDLGQPLDTFTVRARTKTQGMLSGFGAETIADRFSGSSEGEFFLDGLRTGAWLVTASATDHAGAEALEVELGDEGREGLVLVLPRGARATGIVVDGYGNPVADATVAPELKLEAMDFASGPDLPSALTDANGRFTLEGLAPGPLALTATAADFAASEAYGVELAPGDTETGVVLTLRTGGSIRGTIYGPDGEPAAGERIMAQNPVAFMNQLTATSDSDGEFVFESLTPGSYQVMSFPRGGEGSSGDEASDMAAMFSNMKFTMCDVVEGEETLVSLGAPPADPVLLSGRVLLADEPVAGAMVSFMADGGGGMDGMRMANSGPDGRFEFELNESGTYLVSVQKILGTGQQQTVEFREVVPKVEQHEVLLELPQSGIAGEVRSESGEPLANLRITLGVDGPMSSGSFTGGNYAELTTDEDGRYEILWVRPGTYSVSAGGAAMGGLFGDSGEQIYGRQSRSGLRVEEGQILDGVDFTLGEPGRLRGRVLDLAGEPVPEAAIFLRDDAGRLVDKISMVRSDASGNFSYSGLAPGSYSASARLDDRVTHQPLAVTVSSGEVAEANLRVDTGTMLLITLTDDDGNAVECRLSVTDPEGHEVFGMWSLGELMAAFGGGSFSSTEQRVGPLPPGSYRITAESDGGLSAKKSVKLDGQETRRVKLRLD